MSAERHIPDESIPHAVVELCEKLAEHRFRAWIVGGCIRDLLMGRAVSDWDLATDALPEQVRKVFRRTIPTGIAHGTITVLSGGGSFEVTTLRTEGGYTDGRRPDSVAFVSDIDADLARRDFTVNAIAYDPLAHRITDPWGGCADLDARIIRAVRDPEERFAEDGLRPLRAARFAASLEFELDPATEAAIPATLGTLARVSAERVLAEILKMLRAPEPSRGLRVMRRTGMLGVVAKPLVSTLAPRDTGDDSRFERDIARVDAAPRDPAIRLAALLLDLRHERGRRREVEAWLRQVRASNALREEVLHLLFLSEAPSAGEGDAALRRWMRDVARPRLEAALALERADARVRAPRDEAERQADALEARVKAVLASGAALSIGELAIGGNEVREALERAPGRWLGDTLAALHERVLDDPSLNTREALLALVPGIAAAVVAAEEKR